MRLLILLLVSSFALLVIGQDADLGILNYALTLEHLEAAFYKQGIAAFTAADFAAAGYPSYTYPEFQRIAEHEKVHVDTLISVIEAAYPGRSVPACQYEFPINGVEGFVAIARSLELTGVSAYLGRVADITTKGYLTAAATITTIEARHAAFINVISKYSGAPAAFDTPLGARSVVSIASMLIKSCPYDLGVTPYPKLVISSVDASHLRISTQNLTSGGASLYCHFVGPTQSYTSVVDQVCSIPANMSGDIYVFLTNSVSPITLAPGGDAGVIAGPAVLTLDTKFKFDTPATQAPTTQAPTTQTPTTNPPTQTGGGQNVININFQGILAGAQVR